MTGQISDSEDSVESDKIVASGSVNPQPSADRRKLFRRLVTLAGLGLVGAVLSQDKTGLLPTVNAASMTIDAINTGAATTDLDSTTGAGAAFLGSATAGSGTTFGVQGASASTSGRGVLGSATAGSGSTFGVEGDSSSTSGIGVFGHAIAGSGSTYGVEGASDSTSGVGVFGAATAGSGVTYGVLGESVSPNGTGVLGHTLTGSGVTYGVLGESDSTSGTGVLGFAAAGSGTTYGVLGLVSSASGVPIVAKGAASQSANLQEWQNSSGSALSVVDALGSFRVDAAQTNNGSRLNNGSSTGIGLVFGGSASGEGISSNRSTGGNDLEFWTNSGSSTPRMTISNAGNVGIGNTNPNASLTIGSSSLALVTPIAAFGQQGAWERDTSDGNGFQFSWVKTRGGAACHTNDSIGDLAFDFMNTTPTLVQGAVQRGIVTNPTAGSESTGFQFYCMNSGSMGLRVQITSNGNVLASGFVNTSDMRFKEDIQPIDNALDKIVRLEGVYFKWNQEYRERLKRSDSLTRQVGLVAQQVREVIPEIVSELPDKEAGNHLGVDYNKLVPVLVQAIKEQQTTITQLNLRVANLERTNEQYTAS